MLLVPHVLVLVWFDNPGAQQVFGPYPSESEARAAKTELESWPALANISGQFEVHPCTPPPVRQTPTTPGWNPNQLVPRYPFAQGGHITCNADAVYKADVVSQAARDL